ncbi:proline-rich protein 23B-like [Mustela putorius furo]|uniref:Proline-rich protein 23B-like n=1 Tax=Mustela putorius furo TaxID=9669 RepID=A0A8U0SKZ7_MUSPF|nr:proline-rich protein 23B-like [Mustela putorius furo]
MGSWPRSPSAYPESCWGPPPRGPRPAKRRRTQQPAGLEGSLAADTLTSVVVLATGCALQLLLDDVDLVLEPEPTSALQVTVGELTLVLVPEALLRSGGQGHSPASLERGAFPSAPEHDVAVDPRSRSPLRYFNLDAHLLEPFPNSPLQPLPPSRSPGSHARPGGAYSRNELLPQPTASWLQELVILHDTL